MLIRSNFALTLSDFFADVFYHGSVLGRHGDFAGRKYRRGKNRCYYCGAPLTAKDRTPVEDWLRFGS